MIWLGIGLFFGAHLIPSVPGFREQLMGKLGANGYKGIFSVVSLAGIILLSMGYSRMDYQELWPTPEWAGSLALVVMPFVILLWISAELKGNIRKSIKHPMMIGMLLWSTIHLINNGDVASMYLFGSFAVYSAYSVISSIRKGSAPSYEIAKPAHDVLAVGVSVVLSAGIIFWAHEFVFGVVPI